MTNEDIVNCIEQGNAPAGLRGGRLDFSRGKGPLTLPPGLHCHTLKIASREITTLPADLRVDFKLDATGCAELAVLPEALSVPVLVLRACTALRALPEQMQVDYLDIQDCTALSEWPATARVTVGNVNARNCRALKCLPPELGPITSLSLAGCQQIDSIPAGVVVRSWLDIAGTGVTSLPQPLSHIALRWRGVAINAQIAFFPETITSEMIFGEPNAEVRRVMIERVGFERFLSDAKAEVIHRDKDAGGPRELLRVKLEGDEDLVCVSVRCPSTGRHYLIRVPPGMSTCHQAVAWTAGFDNPDEYNPIQET